MKTTLRRPDQEWAEPWPTAAGNQGGAGQAPSVTQQRPLRVLAVDDTPAALKLLSLFLERQEDFALIGTAIDGYHALRRVTELEPDLVLLDVQMPGVSGLEVARRIKARPSPPVVIMLTAEDTFECRAAAKAAGADGFVGKRHMFTNLPEVIRKLFANSSTPQPEAAFTASLP